MCLVGVALNVNAAYPLVVVANRDEAHARATAPAARWEDATDIVGGRDLESGGTWQGVSSSGRVGMVINYAGRPKRQVDMRSRGELVHDWLEGGEDSATFIAQLRKRELEYAGFCLIIGSAEELMMIESAPAIGFRVAQVPTGVSAYSNSPLGPPWPKVEFLRSQFAERVSATDLDMTELLDLLATRGPVHRDSVRDASDMPTVASQPFVLGQDYGTRSSSVLTCSSIGSVRYMERSYDAAGGVTEERSLLV